MGATWAIDLGTGAVRARLGDPADEPLNPVAWVEGDRLLTFVDEPGSATRLITAAALMHHGTPDGVPGPTLRSTASAGTASAFSVSPSLDYYVSLSGDGEGGIDEENLVQVLRPDGSVASALPQTLKSTTSFGFGLGSWGVLGWADATTVVVAHRTGDDIHAWPYALTYSRLNVLTHSLTPFLTSPVGSYGFGEFYRFAPDVVAGGVLRPGAPPRVSHGPAAILRLLAALWTGVLTWMVLVGLLGGFGGFFGWTVWRARGALGGRSA
jgi:hypothetical protein